MKVSLSWLRAIAPDIPDDVEAVADTLAARGAPVESIEPVAQGLDDIVVARVEAVEEHPNADRLRLCRVVAEPGEEPRQVVCGAPNVVAGGLYPFAPVGATLPGGMQIGEVKLRGERSRGMLCSAHELTLGPDESGLMTLPDGLEVGARLIDALGLADRRLDVEVTANRGDLLGHVGVAREASPGGQASLTFPAIPDSPGLDLDLVRGEREASASGATIRIEAPELCARYLGGVIRDVEVGPSPAWLQARLRSVGARPINNVVDATNYVMLETGQPLHAFDLATLADGTIVVRTPAADEERFVTLDGGERSLDPSMLLICDARAPVAIAGVMGGRDSEVTGTTTDVLLECALFDPASIRSTRRALDLSTDASYRFERGVDPEGMDTALRRACEIIRATAGGRVEPAVADCRPRPWSPETVELRVGRVSSVLGVPFTSERVTELLEPLGFGCDFVDDGSEVEAASDAEAVPEATARPESAATTDSEDPAGATLRVRVPGWRSYDVTREVDLIEEVARAHGYDAFPEELGAYRPGTVPDHPLFRLEDQVRDLLVAEGVLEAQTPAFVPAEGAEVRVLNPVSTEQDHLRRDLLPSLLGRVEHNWARGTRDVRLFEVGTSFRSGHEGEPPREEPRVAVALTGRRRPRHWSGDGACYDLWDVKALAGSLGGLVWPGGSVRPGAPDAPDLAAPEAFTLLDGEGETVGWAGRLRDDALDGPPWADPVFGVEVALPPVPAEREPVEYRPLPELPGVDRDLALVVPASLEAATLLDAIRAAAAPHLDRVSIFDQYTGEGVERGRRSLAFRLRFQSFERTLTDEDVDEAIRRVVETLERDFDVEPRG